MSTIEKALAKQKKAEELKKQQSSLESTQNIDKREPGIEPTEQINEQMPADTNVSDSHASAKTVSLKLDILDEQGYVSLSTNRKLINEELRAIKRKVLQNAFGGLSKTLKAANLVTVTSTRPGEGKSFCAINLALSIALEQDKTVLLVDADVLKPSVSSKLDIKHQVDAGLMEYLLDEVTDVTDIIYNTNIDNLRFIPAGRPNHLSTELLASEKMAQLAQEFVTRYPDRIVVMDAPPLLGINETAVLANLAGQVLVVVEEEKTHLSELKQAVEQIDKDKAVGFVMNKAKKQSSTTGYGYGYAYAYASNTKN
ncbi:XrtA-associated tyrosine autokinase [Catenovulum sp. 2E275]|uniref:XrtA-associated tyrosine autokinase n=1 Tax=Catenovulum sp. 2E275 TaxID=2980497 RepID=UPI0021D2EA33|nr:XrtA-associated tyrosine autokinase [Catenovulum sp. 2E275]MCU4675531.1 XrtA-associated tyrosine autokinase [Catenovulum sp. 2E275]